MRRVLIAVVVVLLFHSPLMADAPGGTIAVYGDPQGESCYSYDLTPGLLQVYVIHLNHDGMTGSQFKVEIDGKFDAVYLGEFPADPNDVTAGYAYEGIMMAYGTCMGSPTHILTMSFYVQGNSPHCCAFRVVPHPLVDPPGLAAVNCDFDMLEAEGGTTYVNPDGTCACLVPGVSTPTLPTTWGKVKSLYAMD
jgi:hypothetical protein